VTLVSSHVIIFFNNVTDCYQQNVLPVFSLDDASSLIKCL